MWTLSGHRPSVRSWHNCTAVLAQSPLLRSTCVHVWVPQEWAVCWAKPWGGRGTMLLPTLSFRSQCLHTTAPRGRTTAIGERPATGAAAPCGPHENVWSWVTAGSQVSQCPSRVLPGCVCNLEVMGLPCASSLPRVPRGLGMCPAEAPQPSPAAHGGTCGKVAGSEQDMCLGVECRLALRTCRSGAGRGCQQGHRHFTWGPLRFPSGCGAWRTVS